MEDLRCLQRNAFSERYIELNNGLNVIKVES